MLWVRSEYAGELAVLSALLSALLPWNVTYSSEAGGVFFLRFPFFEVQYLLEIDVDGGSFFLLSLPTAAAQQAGRTVAVAYRAWAVGALFVGLALLLAVAYYLAEERVEAAPVDPARVMGALLVPAGLVFAVTNYLIVARGLPGIPIPVGALLMLVFGGVLLTVDRR